MRKSVKRVKKNIRKIPDHIRQKLSAINQEEIVACCSLKADTDAIMAGEFSHLGISFDGIQLSYPEEHLPLPSQGRFSRWNVYGREVKRKDLPKEPFNIYVDVPNWGDYSKGTHTIVWERERYPIDYYPPRFIALRFELLNPNTDDETFWFRVTATEVLSKSSAEFEERLFFCFNLLQENVGGFDVAPSGLSKEQYVRMYWVDWEILPVGNRDLIVNRLSAGQREPVTTRHVIAERYDFFMSLGAKEIVFGTSGFARYFGARIEDDLVVFENLRYGNAIYIMYEDWRILSKRSRTELLTGRLGSDFDRVTHSGAWQNKVRRIVHDRQRRTG